MTQQHQPKYLDDPQTKCELQKICGKGYPGKNSRGEIVCFTPNCEFDTRSSPPAASEIKTCFDLKEYGESIRNQTLDDKRIILKEKERIAISRYESATTKNEEVYQHGIVMGLQMAIESLHIPSPQEHKQ